ncbi:DUF3108 domain-containing protein [Akkermansiaceae bacterium]|nr:DUF3108 domain-containing protein [Akkermansiaceae bacterium]
MNPLITLFLTLACASASPAWEAELSPAKPGPHPPIPPCSLAFTLSWKGMLKAGQLTMDFAPKGVNKPGSLVIKCSASSRGAAAALFPYRHSYWSEIRPSTLASRYFHSTEEDSKEKAVTTIRYSRTKADVTEISTDLQTTVATAESFAFPYGSARDLFSAILYIRSQKLEPGEQHTLLLLPFKTPYLLKVRCEAKEMHLGQDALRLSFALHKIDRKTLTLGSYKKLKKPVTVWLSDDADRFPIELRASVYIGDVRAVLTGFSKTP